MITCVVLKHGRLKHLAFTRACWETNHAQEVALDILDETFRAAVPARHTSAYVR
jgi:hypothetical protein